jgi:membrane-associated phospholipid phosphatase
MTLPAATLAAVSLFSSNTRFQDAAFTSLETLLAAGAVSYGLKYAFGRHRPADAPGPFTFAPFSGHSSFPSGHATTAFAVLTPWVLYYPNLATYSLFAVSTGTAVARLAHNEHWATDVLAGSAVGFLMGYWLTKRHQAQTAGRPFDMPDRLSVRPALSPNGIHLAVRVTLSRSAVQAQP